MRSLNNTGVTVPGGFRWFCEDSKQWVPSVGSINNYIEFMHKCKLHCQANNLPIGSQFEAQIQDQICRGLNGDWCLEGGFPIPPSGGWSFTVEHVRAGSHRLSAAMIQAKARRVPSEVSTQRAAICVDCPYNQAPVGCSSCNVTAMNNAADTVDGAVAIDDPRLKSCKISAFSLKAKINVPSDVLRSIISESQIAALPERCWLSD